MKRLFGFLLAGLLIITVCAIPAWAGGGVIKVMTRNQYLGADLTPLILAQTLEDFLDAANEALLQVGLNNFPLRAQRLAREVAITKPDIIGLQEVYNFTVDDANYWPPFVDHLQVFLDALEARGLHYIEAAAVEHLDVTIPIDINGKPGPELVRVLDRDVILVRKGIYFETLSGEFTTGGLCGVPIPNPAPIPPFPPTLQSTVSEDGCNYTIFASVDSPAGPIAAERGFVGVDVTVRGRDYRILNTHLEIRQPDPTDPNSAIIQSLQAVELVGTLKFIQSFMPADRKLILLGDFNSWSEDPVGPIASPYQIIIGAGYADIWDTNILRFFDPDGLTCCQEPDLANTISVLYERVDIIFVKNTSPLSLAFVTGTRPIYPLWFHPNWASDHGGVFAKLFFPSKYRWWNHWKRMKKH